MLIRVIIILFLIPTGLFAQTKTGTKTSTTKTTTSSANTTSATKTSASTTADTLNSLEKAIKNFYSDAVLKNASISFNVVNTADNSVIASYNPNQSLVPASTMKLVTTATALEVLGGGYTFSTTIQYSGTIDSNCVLHGDIFVKGGGDPAHGSKYFKDHYEGFLDKWA
jgi:D-alanyl-D-alanine carboxypeptidase/D-alanyl-D-alanine-endopeptidase (penicillin-binding protein 4)